MCPADATRYSCRAEGSLLMLSFRSGGLYSGVSLRIVLLILAFLAGAASGLFLAKSRSPVISLLWVRIPWSCPPSVRTLFGRPVSWLLRFCAPVFAFCGTLFYGLFPLFCLLCVLCRPLLVCMGHAWLAVELLAVTPTPAPPTALIVLQIM